MCYQLAGLGVQAAGAGMQAAGAYSQASAANLARRFNYKMLQRNEQLTNLQAEDAKQRGYEAIAQWKRTARQVIGKQRAAAAGSGVRVEGGSVGAAQAAAQLSGELGAEKLRTNADREAWYLRLSALMYSSQAKMTRATKVSPGLALTTSLLSNVGSMSSSFYGSMNEWKYMNRIPQMPTGASVGGMGLFQ